MSGLRLSDFLPPLGRNKIRYRTLARNDYGLVGFRMINSDCWAVIVIPEDAQSAEHVASTLPPDWLPELYELPNRTHVWARWKYVESGLFQRAITLGLLAIAAWSDSKLIVNSHYPPLKRLLRNPVVPETNHYFSEHLLGGSAVDLPPDGVPIVWPVSDPHRLMWDHYTEDE